MAIKVSGTTVIDDSRNLQNSVNLNATGNVYANTFIGDGSQLTNLPPSGGTVTATASGTLADGSAVIVNADGTVSVVSAISYSPTVFETGVPRDTVAVYDTNANKVVVIYRDLANSNYASAVVGTVSGTSISFGSPVVVNSHATQQIAAVFDSSANKVVIAFQDGENNNYYGSSIVGTVSGSSISFGTKFQYMGNNIPGSNALVFDSNANKVVYMYQNSSNLHYGQAVVGTVSGSTVSLGSIYTFSPEETRQIAATFDSGQNKVVVVYRDEGNSNYGRAKVGTVSGTNISFGSAVTFESSSTSNLRATFDTNSNKVVVSYGASSTGKVVIGTIAGGGITFGSSVQFFSGLPSGHGLTFDSNLNKVFIAYQDNLGSPILGKGVYGTVSGTSISFDTPVAFEDSITNYHAPVFDPDTNQIVIAYQDQTDSSKGKGVVLLTSLTTLTSENFLGISDGVYANNATATIQVAGSVDDAQSGLTPGQQYFVQANGSIGTTAGSPSVIAGTAVAATKLLVKG